MSFANGLITPGIHLARTMEGPASAPLSEPAPADVCIVGGVTHRIARWWMGCGGREQPLEE